MAEYNSLYINIKIDEEKLAQFLAATPIVHNVDDNWRNWWDTREMHNKTVLADIPTYPVPNHKLLFDEFLGDPQTGSYTTYDAEKQEWLFVAVFFSENYVEILPMLSLLKTLQTYSMASAPSTALIYDFYWGGTEVMAAMSLHPDEAFLTNATETAALDTDVLPKANKTIEAVLEELSKRHD